MAYGQVTLLRGINVGRAKRVAMAELRTILSDLGFREVRTLLNSGNIVFLAPDDDPGASAERIEAAMISRLGVSARALVLSGSEFSTVMRENTLEDVAENASRLQVAFLANPTDRSRLAPLMERSWGQEVLAVGSRAAYLWCPAGLTSSDLAQAVGKVLGDAVTIRTSNTVKKIEAALEPLVRPHRSR
ncbi:MAG: DUF1697 domain-containing protein [Gemmatimonas sp.]|nr:DUF1697 domain-containing protein [Gemmatimonas sp.]